LEMKKGSVVINSGMGAILNAVTGIYRIMDDSGITGDVSSRFYNNGTFAKMGGGGQSNVGVPFIQGSGLFSTPLLYAGSGTIKFRSTVIIFSGQVALAGGNIASIGAPFQMNGGALVGNGTVYATVVNTGGDIDPGGINSIGS